jgi:hypothetical protein
MTDTTPNDQSLWRVMADAFAQTQDPGPEFFRAYAAELRAIADRVVPEEPPMSRRIQGNAVAKALYLQRQRTRARLLAEADRAEAGEP